MLAKAIHLHPQKKRNKENLRFAPLLALWARAIIVGEIKAFLE
jgi:hypothetical protein